MLSAVEEWQRNTSNQNRDAMLKAATKLGIARKTRKAADAGQDMQAKISSRGIELMEQSRLPNLSKRLRGSAVKPAVAENEIVLCSQTHSKNARSLREENCGTREAQVRKRSSP